MMRFIVTKQNVDGSYDEVGMRNRIPCHGHKEAADAAKVWMREGHKVRVEGWSLVNFYQPEAKPVYLKFFG